MEVRAGLREPRGRDPEGPFVLRDHDVRLTDTVRTVGRTLLAAWLGASVLLVAGTFGSESAAGTQPPTRALAAAAVPIPSCAQQGPCVIVQVVAGQQVTQEQQFYADQITDQGDVTSTSYPVLGGTAVEVEKGSSLSRLVGLVVPLGSVTFAEVVAPAPDAYGRHPLSRAEVGTGGTGFEDGLLPAFYSTDPDKSRPTRFNYVRPQRDPDDANGSPGPDQGTFFSDLRGALLVRVHTTGSLLDVEVTGTPVGDTGLTYSLSSDPSGPDLTYDWVLPDGSRTAEAAPTYTFPEDSEPGSYPATVGLERSDGSFGWGRTALTVDEPTETATATASPSGPGGTGSPSVGPTRSPSGTASGEPNPTTGTGGSGGPSGSGGATGSATGTASALPTGSPASTPGQSVTAPPPTAPSPPTSTSDGSEVIGILLTAVQGGAQDASASDAPRPTEAGRPVSDEAFSIRTGVWCGIGVVLLLVGGAGSESGRLRGWLRRRWSRMAS